MEARIHEVLDGERPPEDLTPAERDRLADYREVIDHQMEALRREPVRDMAPSVLARIAEMEDHAERADERGARSDVLSRALAWVMRPRRIEISLRPAHGLLAAAALAAVLLAVPGTPGDVPVASFPVAADAPDRVLVHFRLDAPGASSVRLAGDFTDWQPLHEMRQVTPGVWSLVVPLEPGVHDYGFVVDGEQWRTDPQAPSVDDGFGGMNSRLALLSPQEQS